MGADDEPYSDEDMADMLRSPEAEEEKNALAEWERDPEAFERREIERQEQRRAEREQAIALAQ